VQAAVRTLLLLLLVALLLLPLLLLPLFLAPLPVLVAVFPSSIKPRRIIAAQDCVMHDKHWRQGSCRRPHLQVLLLLRLLRLHCLLILLRLLLLLRCPCLLLTRRQLQLLLATSCLLLLPLLLLLLVLRLFHLLLLLLLAWLCCVQRCQGCVHPHAPVLIHSGQALQPGPQLLHHSHVAEALRRYAQQLRALTPKQQGPQVTCRRVRVVTEQKKAAGCW
jgi:hypothetical protein